MQVSKVMDPGGECTPHPDAKPPRGRPKALERGSLERGAAPAGVRGGKNEPAGEAAHRRDIHRGVPPPGGPATGDRPGARNLSLDAA